ncbi:uncharacterized protein LOC126836396 isoform X3 [Adelges cooleyi]|nr:uncharacterized protein LOC126836396 isoform X2 [Adelges cooleyi]XP_050425702.1 uncharacterized protein LOC126836396 isoform X3 [Adelges cooleyi]
MFFHVHLKFKKYHLNRTDNYNYRSQLNLKIKKSVGQMHSSRNIANDGSSGSGSGRKPSGQLKSQGNVAVVTDRYEMVMKPSTSATGSSTISSVGQDNGQPKNKLSYKDNARKLCKWGKKKVNSVKPSLQSLVQLVHGKSSTKKTAEVELECKTDNSDRRRFIPIEQIDFIKRHPRKTMSLSNLDRRFRQHFKPIGNSNSKKSSSKLSLGLPNLAESCFDLDNLHDGKPIRKYKSMVTLSNEVLNLPMRKKPHRLYRFVGKGLQRLSQLAFATSYSTSSSLCGSMSRSKDTVLCKICLNDVSVHEIWTIEQCGCFHCIRCTKMYVKHQINQGAYNISCPDDQCSYKGIMQMMEIEALANSDDIKKHHRFRLTREVVLDINRMFCPRPGCETICNVNDCNKPQRVQCPKCKAKFCAACLTTWHPGWPCLPPDSQLRPMYDPEFVKHCPLCSIAIERNGGCAQILCGFCQHVFCWLCLESLIDDFFLRHYENGKCQKMIGVPFSKTSFS